MLHYIQLTKKSLHKLQPSNLRVPGTRYRGASLAETSEQTENRPRGCPTPPLDQLLWAQQASDARLPQTPCRCLTAHESAPRRTGHRLSPVGPNKEFCTTSFHCCIREKGFSAQESCGACGALPPWLLLMFLLVLESPSGANGLLRKNVVWFIAQAMLTLQVGTGK